MRFLFPLLLAVTAIAAAANLPFATPAVLLHAALPRLAAALAAGAALGLSGALLQAALRNPLASPGTLGIAAGAQLALLAATVAAPTLLATLGREPVALFGAAAATALTLLLAARSRLDPLTTLLCGLVVALGAGALGGVLALLHTNQVSGLFIWAGGALVQDGWSTPIALATRLAPAGLAAAALARPLRLLELSDETARALGLSVPLTRLAAIALATTLAATTTALVGVIGFVGLAAPALIRLAGPARFAPFRCALCGAALLVHTDAAVIRLAPSTAELVPTGAATALLGAPLLLVLLLRLAPPAAPRPAPPPASRPPAAPAPTLAAIATLLAIAAAAALLFGTDGTTWSLDPAFAALRAPRVAGAATAGALLGLAGLLLQRVLRNPIASPDVIGIGTGTTIGLAVAVALGATAPAARFAAAAAGSAAAVTLLLLWGRFGAAPGRMLLAGLALGSAFEGILAILLATGDPRAELLLVLLSGTTWFLDGPTAAIAACLLACGLAAAALFRRPLDLLLLGDALAAGAGLRPGPARAALLLLAAALAGTATLLAGPLSFVGLVAPHGARLLGLHRTAAALPGAALLGALLMVLADWAGRTLLFPHEIPAGAVAALLGGPVLLLALLRTPR